MEGTGFILRIYSPAKAKLSPTTQISLTNEITSANVSLASVAAVCSRLRRGQRPRTNDRTTSCLSPCPSVCLSLSYSSLVHIYSSVSAVLCCRLLLSLSFFLCLLFSACFFFPLYPLPHLRNLRTHQHLQLNTRTHTLNKTHMPIRPTCVYIYIYYI